VQREKYNMKDDKEEYIDYGMLMKLISDHILHHSNKLLNKKNLTLSQLRYLEYIDKSGGPVSFKEVENHFQTSQPTVSGIMRRLAEKDLIKIGASDSGRGKNAELTEKGRSLIDESGAEREKEEKLILSALREDEREPFHDMLVRINKKLSE
jgi:DNA-binding MarR family transcriptional regulator